MPKHLVEGPFLQNKAGILELPYWSTEHVGAGAFKVRQFERGSQAVLDAFDQYVLGRPKIAIVSRRGRKSPSNGRKSLRDCCHTK